MGPSLRLRTLLLVCCLAVLTAPAMAASDSPVTFSGTLRPGVGNSGPSPMPISITVSGGHVTDYQFFVTLHCAGGSVENMGLMYGQMSHAPLRLDGNRLSATVGDRTQGFGLTAKITATIHGNRMYGTVRAEAHADEGVAPSGPSCKTSYHWTAVASTPASTPPAPDAQPYVRVTLDPVAIPVSASSYSYGIAVGNVICANGAKAFTVSTTGHRATLTCSATVSRPLTKAIMGLSAGDTYSVRIQAIDAAGRPVAGAPQQFTVRIPPAGSPEWKTIPGL